MRKQYRSRIMAAIHETAEDLHTAGLMDKRTMRKFDEACLTPVRSLSGAEIRALREREGASQAVFARYLNVTTGLVSQWERGEKHPQGTSLKLLALVARSGLEAVA
ncbi:MAG: helix-turn-helix domain-containing protein [Desulfobaccales bacterium]